VSLSSKAKTLAWFARRPDYWPHAQSLVARKLRVNHDSPDRRAAARSWARSRTTQLESVVRAIGYAGSIGDTGTHLGEERLAASRARVDACPLKLGGAGDLRLLYFSCEALEARRALETGVAYGWSSLAVLASIAKREPSLLTSVDMPYPKLDNESWVGIAVPEALTTHWRLLRQPDRYGILKAIELHDGALDVCHYDSDKSYYGRKWAYPLLWDALRPGGIFISDDIQDNFAFKELVEVHEVDHFVIESHGKYIGVCVKPGPDDP
jgi:predicted O-methyltransferase YrrM